MLSPPLCLTVTPCINANGVEGNGRMYSIGRLRGINPIKFSRVKYNRTYQYVWSVSTQTRVNMFSKDLKFIWFEVEVW